MTTTGENDDVIYPHKLSRGDYCFRYSPENTAEIKTNDASFISPEVELHDEYLTKKIGDGMLNSTEIDFMRYIFAMI